MKILPLAALLVSVPPALAEAPGAPPPPALPTLNDREAIEPEVRIIQRDGETVEEYRINGQLYMIKVTPDGAPPYYLVDSNGDGNMDASPSEIEPNLMVPNWVLFRW